MASVLTIDTQEEREKDPRVKDFDFKELNEERMYKTCVNKLSAKEGDGMRDDVIAMLCIGRDDVREYLNIRIEKQNKALAQNDNFQVDTDEALDIYFDLEPEKDAYNMLLLCESFSIAQFGCLLVCASQLYVLWLIFKDLTRDELRPVEEEDENRFNIPMAINNEVAIAQAIAIIVALFTEDDLLTSVEAVFMVDFEKTAKEQALDISPWWWYFANFLRWSEGTLTILVSFTLVAQATEVLEIFMNFAAVSFVSNLDNVVYGLAASGYFGSQLHHVSVEIEKLSFKSKRGKWRSILAQFAVFGNLLVLLVGWGVVRYFQRDGVYVEAESCGSVRVNFPDITYRYENGRRPLSYSFFSGLYTTVLNGDDRPFYYEGEGEVLLSTDQRGLFYYCRGTNAWHFTIPALGDGIPESTTRICSAGWLLQSPITDAFFLDEVPTEGWNIIRGSGVMATLGENSLKVKCGECSLVADCSLNGRCEDGRCVCDGAWGLSCQWDSYVCNRLTQVQYGEDASSFKVMNVVRTVNDTISNLTGQLDKVQIHERPIFVNDGCQGSDECLVGFYGGARWFFVYMHLNDTLEDVFEGFHAFWSNYTVAFSSGATENELPTGLTFAGSGVNAGRSYTYECTDMACDDDPCNGFACVDNTSSALPSNCDCDSGYGGLFCEISMLSQYTLDLFCEYCYKGSSWVEDTEYYRRYWDSFDVCRSYDRDDFERECPRDMIEPPNLPNEMCTDASAIELNRLQAGSTLSSEVLDLLPTCGSASATNSRGVLYYFVGEGETVKVSTCHNNTDFDTQLSVFRGNCDALTCVDGNDDFCGVRSEVTWFAEQGYLYYVLVYGRKPGDHGNFELFIARDSPIKEVMPNGLCNNAAQEVASLAHYHLNARDPLISPPQCGAATYLQDSHAKVFHFVGDASTVKISTCEAVAFGPSILETDFDTQIAVFSGSCEALQCVTGNNDACGLQSTVVWYAELGVSYYIFVTGYRGETGLFTMKLDARNVSNDACDRALLLDVDIDSPVDVSGFLDSTPAVRPPRCGSAPASFARSTAVYYIVGKGNGVRANACGHGTNFNVQITVTEGGCESTECVGVYSAGEKIECGDKSVVEWYAYEGVRYTIFLYGRSGEIGNFDLGLVEIPTHSNYNCERATKVSLDSIVSGSIEWSPAVQLASCGSDTAIFNDQSVAAYMLEGAGTPVKVSTCNTNTTFHAQIAVFMGVCDSQTCVDGNSQGVAQGCGDKQSEVEWYAETGVNYTIFVIGYNGAAGDFVLHVERSRAHANYDCDSARRVHVNTTISSFIGYSSESSSPRCGISDTAVFYFVGDGTAVEASTCGGNTEFATRIAVAAGTCAGLDCNAVSTFDFDCEYGNGFVWLAEMGIRYTLFVYGTQFPAGDFVLTLAQSRSHSNYDCESATQIGLESKTEGYIGWSPTDQLRSYGIYGNEAVYYLIGDGTTLIASTCSPQTTFDTRLTVFRGTCEAPVNEVENDDNEFVCGLSSEVVWYAQAGIRYTIYVSGKGEDRNFVLNVERNREHSNYNCENAMQISPQSSSHGYIGWSPAIQINVPICDLGSDWYETAAVYSLVGTGSSVMASTCDAETNFRANILVVVDRRNMGVSSGGCGAPECVAWSHGRDYMGCTESAVRSTSTSDVAWYAEEGVRYTIYVAGSGRRTRDFVLHMDNETISGHTNYKCEMALQLTPNSRTLGFLGGSAYAQMPQCSTRSSYGGLSARDPLTPAAVYYLIGEGKQVTASTCGPETTFDTWIDVVSGSCNELACVVASSNDADCSGEFQGASRVSWLATRGVRYTLFVSGTSGVGDFVLDISSG